VRALTLRRGRAQANWRHCSNECKLLLEQEPV